MYIYLLLIINFIFVLLYINKNIKNKSMLLISLLFIFLPVIGFLIYIIAIVITKIYNSKIYDRMHLVGRYKFENEDVAPDIDGELDLVPIGDAMVYGSNHEKRKLMLDQMKKDIHSNYKNILTASTDEDSETAHYVASAKMEVYNKLNDNLLNAKEQYEENTDDISTANSFLDALINIIESELLSPYENDIYIADYCSVFSERLNNDSSCSEKDKIKYFDKYIEYSVEKKKCTEAIDVFNKVEDGMKNENMYKHILKMYYNLKDKDNFNKILDKLCHSSITLSNEGVELIRFWISEGN